MSYRMKTVDPEKAQKRREHEMNGDVEFILECWNCHKDFSAWIGLGNMMQNIFRCPYCEKSVEMDE